MTLAEAHPAAGDRNRAFTRYVVTIVMYLALFFALFQSNGAPVSIGGVAVSNVFVTLFVLGVLTDAGFYRRFPRYFLAPCALLLAVMLLSALGSRSAGVLFAIQGILFLITPYVAVRLGLERPFLVFNFVFVASSQIYLLAVHGGTLPIDDIGGYFANRRTVHSLALGFLATLVLPYIRNPWLRIGFFAGVFLILLLSQARGAAIVFGVVVLVFGGDVLPGRTRIAAGVFAAVAVSLSVLMSPGLLAHYRLALSLVGGSSTGYRIYLIQILVSEFHRYWLFGMADSEVQHLLARQFTGGRLTSSFALDNAFVHFAMKFGAIPLGLLVLIAVRLAMTRRMYAVFFLGWMFLDDVLGSGLGWLFLGTALAMAHPAAARS